jgi:hypothetical protein
MSLELHPLAEMFPPLDPDRLQELAEDIKTNGQILPIVLLDGRILDGRSRYLAARMAGREPVTADFNASEYNRTPLEFVFSMNIQRRDLTPSQRAAIAADLAEILAVQTAFGEAAAPLSRRTEDTPPPLSRAVAKQAAETLNVSERAVYDANRLRKKDPAGFEQVKKGKKTLGQATNRKSRAKRGVDPEKLEAIAGAIGSEANMANSLFDGVSISAGEIKDLAGKSPDQIKRIYRLLRAGISYRRAVNAPTGPGPVIMLSMKLSDLTAKWMAEYGNGAINGPLTVVDDVWRFTARPLGLEIKRGLEIQSTTQNS